MGGLRDVAAPFVAPGLSGVAVRDRLKHLTPENVAIIAVDPAYTSKWGAQRWQQPLSTPSRKTSRHDAASIAIGRRAQGHPLRRRTAPPRAHQSDVRSDQERAQHSLPLTE
ncbi:hypothetical protein GCM10010309_54440 [Streptomyces violaceochromogenes]|nr:hypothetical protein GCM10010309_54440 [Streptomyces violaceochromogenes]